ncbi:hypothetical protein K432DRAFT_69091 [Lepidopterella palustris CBS 459.81]|uniref:Uncharacterized protein n=1 Tax=Lepidopterella palustris CBS 459.81 TaxID=1314670 RepID=A0A8E2E8I5_9PEZI|nr:hypothetical protein K432DRAFT_69091 [Lepidopterella palustris CBS 459.81]
MEMGQPSLYSLDLNCLTHDSRDPHAARLETNIPPRCVQSIISLVGSVSWLLAVCFLSTGRQLSGMCIANLSLHPAARRPR